MDDRCALLRRLAEVSLDVDEVADLPLFKLGRHVVAEERRVHQLRRLHEWVPGVAAS